MRIFADTRNMSREDWVASRRFGLGGSDAAAIVGMNNYVSPYALWADKTGRLADKEDNEAMRQGRDLEEYVAQRFVEATGKRVRRRNAMLQHDVHDFMIANIDREVVGERAGLECKTTSVLNLKKFKHGEFPANYYAQCMHYLAVTGYDRWYLAVVVLGSQFLWFCIERDEEEIAALIQLESTFWAHVQNDTPPPTDGLQCTSDTLSSIYPCSNGERIALYDCDKLLEVYGHLKLQKKDVEMQIAEIENVIKAEMQDAEYATAQGFAVSWKTQTRNTLQPKEIAKAYPDINLQLFTKSSTARVFRVTERKE